MTKMSKIISLITVFIFAISILEVKPDNEETGRSIKRQSEDCKLNVTIRGCKNQNYEQKLFPKNDIEFFGSFQSNCVYDDNDVTYIWTLYKKTNGDNYEKISLLDFQIENNVFTIPAFKLPHHLAGYKITLKVKAGDKNTAEESCVFFISLDPPVAIIQGGKERVVAAGDTFIVDGSKSLNNEVPPEEPPSLTYGWSCEVVEGDTKEFCTQKFEILAEPCPLYEISSLSKDILDVSILKVPAKYAIKNYKYKFTLRVKSRDYTNWTQYSASQLVTITENLVELEIICEKNCPPAAPNTDSSRTTYLRVRCLKNCEGLSEYAYEWTVEDVPDFDYQQSTQFGRHTRKFIVKPNVFKPGNQYNIRVGLTGGHTGTAVANIEIHVPPKIMSCEVKPRRGKADSTKFKVDCVIEGKVNFYEIRTVKNKKSVKIARNSRIENLEFSLPANTEVYIRITDPFNSIVDRKLDVTVESEAEDDDKNQISVLTEQFKKLIAEGIIDDAIQFANGIIERAENNKKLDKTIKYTLLKGFKSYHIQDAEEGKRIAQVINRLVNQPGAKSDPFQGAIATNVCKRVAEVQLNHMKKTLFPTTLSKQAKENTKTLMGCGEVDTKENFEILHPTLPPLHITTPFPILTMPAITEDYPDYVVNEELVANKTKKFEESAQNFVSICELNLKIMALTVVEGEQTVVASTNSCSVEVTKMIGKKIFERKINARGVTIKPSEDLQRVEDPITVLICSWSNDIFWWNYQRKKVITNVVLLKMTENDTELVKFREPNRIILDVDDGRKEIKVHEIVGVNTSVIRIDVRKRESFFIEFHNVTDDETFRILFSNFKRPNVKKIYKKGRKVRTKMNIFFQHNDFNFNSWYYFSVLPEKSSDEFKYSFSVYSTYCYFWNTEKKLWEFACESNFTSSNSKLECHCNHLSILAGMVYNNHIKIDTEVLDPDFEMVLLPCLIIFISVCIIFALYCTCLLSVLIKKRKTGGNIYLPGDTSSSYLYLYLVRIRTGRRLSSGTSSNICLRLFGSKHRSKSHVLNYPDPYKLIFQWGNEDWFILPTQYYLGKLTKIALWTDYSGRSPKWFCSDVKVYDLQTKENCFFNINTWFNLPPAGRVYVVASPNEEVVEKISLKTVFTRIWPRWSHQADLNVFVKLTLMLSAILTIFLAGLFLYGLPMLRLNDGFAKVNDYALHPHVILIALASSAVSFLIHNTLLWIFKKKMFLLCCWMFLIFNVTISTTILLIFGFWLPMITGWLWLTSMIIAVFFYFFILDNINEKLISIYCVLEEDMEQSTLKIILQEVKVQRRELFKRFGEDLLRPYFTHLYKPLDNEDIKEKKLKEASRFQLLSLIEDTTMFVCYVCLLYLAVLANKHPLTLVSNHEMLEMTEGVFSRSEETIDIDSIESFYTYLNNTLIPTMQGLHWYGKYVVEEPGLTTDFNNKYLGVIRLRQKRINLRRCMIPVLAEEGMCISEYWSSTKSKKRFGPKHTTRLSHIWNYTEPEVAGTSVVIGKFGIYTGGGYVAPLGRNLYNSYVNLDYFRTNNWLDRASSVIFVEFLTYNPNTNLFNAVRMTVEKSVTGYIRVGVNVKTSQLLFVQNEEAIAHVIIFSSFFLIVFIFAIKIVSRVIKKKFFFFKDLWMLIDLFIVALSYSCFAFFIHRSKAVKNLLDKMETAKKNEFVNYFGVFHEDLTFTLVAAFLIFISTIRLWKLCRFATVFRIMEKTVILALFPLLAVSIYHLVCLLAFTLSICMVFGGYFDMFKDIRNTLVMLFVMSVRVYRNFDHTDLFKTNPVAWGLFYCVFMVMGFAFLTIYIAIIIISYHEAQLMEGNKSDFKEFKIFVAKEFKYYVTLVNVALARLRAGGRNRKYVTPKTDSERYANCLTIDEKRIEMMKIVSILYLKKEVLDEEEKIQLMKKIILCKFTTGGKEIFFSMKNERNRLKLIHDDSINEMADIVQRLLGDEWSKKKQSRLHNEKRIRKQLKRMDFVLEMLKAMLHIVNNVQIE